MKTAETIKPCALITWLRVISFLSTYFAIAKTSMTAPAPIGYIIKDPM